MAADVRAQRLLLLLAAGHQEAALQVADQLIADGAIAGDEEDGDHGLWEALVKYAPRAAALRLRQQIDSRAPEAARSHLRFLLVEALRNCGDAEAARRQIEALLAAEPGDAHAVRALARLDSRAAIDYLERRLAVAPDADTWTLYGQQLEAAANPGKAAHAYWQAWMAEPEQEDHIQRMLSLDPGRYADAILHRARAATGAIVDEAIGDVGTALWRVGQHDRAVTLWEEALRLDPDDDEWPGYLRAVRDGRDPLR